MSAGGGGWGWWCLQVGVGRLAVSAGGGGKAGGVCRWGRVGLVVSAGGGGWGWRCVQVGVGRLAVSPGGGGKAGGVSRWGWEGWRCLQVGDGGEVYSPSLPPLSLHYSSCSQLTPLENKIRSIFIGFDSTTSSPVWHFRSISMELPPTVSQMEIKLLI